MKKRAMLAVLTALAMVVTACGGGVPEAAAPNDTIAVHGDWTIDIYNADGTLDEHIEFENALTTGGEQTLVNLLTGTATASGNWTIELTGPTPLCPSEVFGQCVITPITANPVDTNENGLEEAVQLSGSVVAEADGDITVVSTFPGLCGGNQAPDDCPSARWPAPFTTKTLTDRPAVTAGQTVQVEVVISFTTG